MSTHDPVAPLHREEPHESTPRRPEPKQQRSRERYERLLDAAEALLVREGYDGFTTSAVSTEAGLPPSALYRWFTDKDDLASALVRRHNRRLSEAVTSAVGRLIDPSLATVAAEAFVMTADYYRRNPSHQILWFEARIGEATRREVHRYTQEAARWLIEWARTSGAGPAVFTDRDALLILEIADRVLEVVFRDDRQDAAILEEATATIVQLIERVTAPPLREAA